MRPMSQKWEVVTQFVVHIVLQALGYGNAITRTVYVSDNI